MAENRNIGDDKTDNSPQNTTQKTKDWTTWTSLKLRDLHRSPELKLNNMDLTKTRKFTQVSGTKDWTTRTSLKLGGLHRSPELKIEQHGPH
jgi:hypothetical protein